MECGLGNFTIIMHQPSLIIPSVVMTSYTHTLTHTLVVHCCTLSPAVTATYVIGPRTVQLRWIGADAIRSARRCVPARISVAMFAKMLDYTSGLHIVLRREKLVPSL